MINDWRYGSKLRFNFASFLNQTSSNFQIWAFALSTYTFQERRDSYQIGKSDEPRTECRIGGLELLLGGIRQLTDYADWKKFSWGGMNWLILTRQDIEFETGQESYAVHDWADQVVKRLHLKFNELKIIRTSDRQKFVTFIENNISQIFLIRSFLSCQRNFF